MSEVDKTISALLDPKELLDLYFSGKGSLEGRQRMGIEIETWCVQQQDSGLNPRIRMMSPDESQEILTAVARNDPQAEIYHEKDGVRLPAPRDDAPIVCVNSGGISYQLELCGALEAATRPVESGNLPALLDLIDDAQRTMRCEAGNIGLQIYPCAVPGSIRIEDCGNNLVKRERLRSEWAKFIAEGSDSAGLRTMGLATSAQVSLSYKDPREAYEIMSLANILSPVLYAVFANTTGYAEGKKSAAIPRAEWWLAHNKSAPRGGIPNPILKAIFSGDSEDMIKEWIGYVRSVPMVYHIDKEGLPQFGLSPSFNELACKGLGTRANFALAESLVWPDVKLIGGQRIELRMCDTGPWQPAGLAVLAASLFGSEEVRRTCLSETFKWAKLDPDALVKSREQVGTMGMDAPFGSRRVKDILPILEELILDRMAGFEDRSVRWRTLLEVLETGWSDQMRLAARRYPDARLADLAVCLERK
ncbi:MAG TPA: hypothetical protein VIF12_00740 [Micavibrio sp.]|jgi:gamma-glutamylcysteine synthetase